MSITQNSLDEISEQRSSPNQTLRVVSLGLEEILYKPFNVLDHGFVRVVDYMGNDDSVVQAARVSYGKGTKKKNADKALINYLMAHYHTTPFEMCEIKFHIKLPIFVARQWIRHRTASINEYSARYSLVEDEFYIPRAEVLASQSKKNHQGRDEGGNMSPQDQKKVLKILTEDSKRNYENYLDMIKEGEEGGLARELARMNLTLNCYTQWYWKVDLHNLLNFLRLRADSHAQYEIRVYAEAMLKIAQSWVPDSYDAFIKHRMTGKQFSGPALSVIKKLIKGEKVAQEDSGLSQREWAELMITIEE